MTIVADDGHVPVTLRFRQAVAVRLLIAALIPVILSLLGLLLRPAWSEVERRRRRAIVNALTGEGAG
jgi:hypothetical protein